VSNDDRGRYKAQHSWYYILMKKLLVTGAKGFTGRHFIDNAEKAGYTVNSLISDLTDVESLNAELSKLDPHYVVHLAGLSSVNNQDIENYYRINLFGTLNLLEALSKLHKVPSKVLLASSANVYGGYNKNLITEDLYPKPVNHYAMSKLAMEMMSLSYFQKLPIVVTRPFNYTGVGQSEKFLIPKIINHFKRKEKEIELGNINVLREYNDVRMVCEVYVNLLTSGIKGETYNICSGKAVSLSEIISTLEDLTNHKIKIRINQSLIRANEIEKLSGSSEKIENLIGPLKKYELKETFRWMIEF